MNLQSAYSLSGAYDDSEELGAAARVISDGACDGNDRPRIHKLAILVPARDGQPAGSVVLRQDEVENLRRIFADLDADLAAWRKFRNRED